jgi:hypothetical protein
VGAYPPLCFEAKIDLGKLTAKTRQQGKTGCITLVEYASTIGDFSIITACLETNSITNYAMTEFIMIPTPIHRQGTHACY